MKNSILTAIAATAAAVCVSSGTLASVALASAQPQPGAASADGTATALNDPNWRELAATFGGVETDTEPSRDVVMRFSFPTEIREVLVVGGQRVRQGELLIRARDADVLAQVAHQKLRAGNELEVRAAEQALDLAAFRFRNAEAAKAKDSYSAAEFEERRIELKQAEIQLEQTKMRLQEQQIVLQQAEGTHERFRLEAPFDGTIEEVLVDVGQGANEQVPAIRVVNTEQLWLDAYPRTLETLELALKQGSTAWVLLDLPGGARLAEGKVLYVSPVADSVSQRRRVRVEINNPGGFPAGTPAMVRFTAPTGEWRRVDESVAVKAGAAAGAGSEDAR